MHVLGLSLCVCARARNGGAAGSIRKLRKKEGSQGEERKGVQGLRIGVMKRSSTDVAIVRSTSDTVGAAPACVAMNSAERVEISCCGYQAYYSTE